MSQLDTIVAGLIASAMKKEKTPMAKKLLGGMTVEAMVDGLTLKLTISRRDQYPSDVEWRTVLDHMPWPAPHKVPTRNPQTNSLSALFMIHPKLL